MFLTYRNSSISPIIVIITTNASNSDDDSTSITSKFNGIESVACVSPRRELIPLDFMDINDTIDDSITIIEKMGNIS